MKKNKRKLNYMILIIMILVISIGYAILSSNLNIVGSSQISAPTWDIHWENVQVKTGSVSAQTPTIDTNKTTVNYSVTLTIPGDYYEFTVDAVNAGSIDGMVSVVSNKLNGTEITTLPNYLEYKVTYEDGVDIAPNHLLAANSSEKYKVHVGYKNDISVSDIPSSPQTLNLSFSVTYIQSDSNAVPKPEPYVYTVNKYNSSTTNPKYNGVWLNQTFPTSITKYNTPSEALTAIASASSKDLPFYLKHKIENGIVTESYVEFVVTEEMAQANTGMVAGTYTLRGEKTYDSDTSTWLVDESYISPYYEANKEVIKTAFGYATNSSRCSESGTGRSSNFRCSVSGLNASSNANGDVSAGDAGSSSWGVSSDGHACCDW
ncbi:MAG: hypothetical protein IJ842_02030 [Bacilli bacterium]|nr:hypothetical protein [Bacilli bacterium]